MALIAVDLSSGDQTINATDTGGDTTNTVDITALGSGTLTIDGVSVEIGSIAGIIAAAAPTFEVVNGANLDFDQGLTSLNALSNLSFIINDSSTVTYDSGAIGVASGLLTAMDVTFNGAEDGNFTYVPPAISLLSAITINVHGMEKFDNLAVDGRSNLTFSYNAATDTGTVTSGGGLLGTSVSYVITGMTQAQADYITADLVDTGTDEWVIGDTFIMPVCLTTGTFIKTPGVERLIETLSAGDYVLTLDHGPQKIRWIGRSFISAPKCAQNPKLRPIRFKRGSLGCGRPTRDLLVSPQHRMLLCSKVAERMFGSFNVLIPAIKLISLPDVEVASAPEGVTYMHLLFDAHEVVFAEDAPVESLLLGPMAREALHRDQLEEIRAIFPELYSAATPLVSARCIADGRRGRRLIERHIKNSFATLTIESDKWPVTRAPKTRLNKL